MTLYHISRTKNLESILEKGIIPGYRRGLTCGRPKWDTVFLTNDPDRIIRDQGGKPWETNVVIFELDIEDVRPHEYHCGGTYTLSDFEFTCEKVLPEQIKSHRVL